MTPDEEKQLCKQFKIKPSTVRLNKVDVKNEGFDNVKIYEPMDIIMKSKKFPGIPSMKMSRFTFNSMHPLYRRGITVDNFADNTRENNFMTRFHRFQYAGLSPTFAQKIYASEITGAAHIYCCQTCDLNNICLLIDFNHRISIVELIKAEFQLDESFLHILEPGVPQIISGYEVTAIDIPRYALRC